MGKPGLYEKAKGRSRHDPHVRIYHNMVPTLMARLSGNAVKILVYMLTFETGEHKGVFMGARKAATGCGLSPNTANKALAELDRQGFIRPIGLGHFQVKGGPASSWRFTFLPYGGKGPTNEWREPPLENKSWSQKLRAAVAKNEHLEPPQPPTVAEIDTVEPVSPEIAVAEIDTQIIAITEGEGGEGPEANLDPLFADGAARDARDAA